MFECVLASQFAEMVRYYIQDGIEQAFGAHHVSAESIG